MKTPTLRTLVALLLALFVSACDDSSPTSPSASTASTIEASSGGSGTVAALDKPGPAGALECPPDNSPRNAKGHCHGDDSGDEPPEGPEDTFRVVVTVGGKTSEFDAIGNEINIKEAPGSPVDIELSGIPNPCPTEPNDGDFALQILGTHSCAPGFPWTLDCERVLAGGVSKWGSQIKVRRRRREPGGRPEMLPGNGRGGRFSARRKRETVLRLLRGEDLESVSRELGITAARASQWRDQFLAAGQASLKSRALGTRPIVGCKPRSVSY